MYDRLKHSEENTMNKRKMTMLKQFPHIVCYLLTLSVSNGNVMEMAVANSKKCFHTDNFFNCSGQGRLTLPNEIPLHVETLDLSFNKIENISFFDYYGLSQSLSALNLSHNKISKISSDAFRNLIHIKVLDLSFNDISGRNLKGMDLSDLPMLHHLKLGNNPLRVIHTDTFNFLKYPAVTHLDLSNCEIKELEQESIDIRSLEYLDLSWNQLHVFKETPFHMMPSLKTLDLTHNRITVLDEMPYMPALVTWILDSNFIDTIDIKEKIEDYADNLQELYLRHNNILRFNASNLPLEMESLWLIDMSNNRLHCDCRMRWITSAQYNFKNKSFKFMCSFPSSVSGRNLITVPADDLTCSVSLAKILLILLVCCVILVGLSITVYFIIINRRRREKMKKLAREDDNGGNYTAVYTRDEDDIRVSMPDDKHLLKRGRNVEFDV